MESLQYLNPRDLVLDKINPRTMPQKTEIKAIKAMISTNHKHFFQIMESILEEGFMQVENLVVVNEKKKNGSDIFLVKEGNRRAAALKIIKDLVDHTKLEIPKPIVERIALLSQEELDDLDKIPCVVFDESGYDKAQRIVNRTHGKDAKAGRSKWNSIAKARYNRDYVGGDEYGLDLFEKFIGKSMQINGYHKDQWPGQYPITVLDEALRRLASFKGTTSKNIATSYPHLTYKAALDNIIFDIGIKVRGFTDIRAKNDDFFKSYGLEPLNRKTKEDEDIVTDSKKLDAVVTLVEGQGDIRDDKQKESSSKGSSLKGTSKEGADVQTGNYLRTDPKFAPRASTQAHVRSLLEELTPKGSSGAKIKELKIELSKTIIKSTPLLFCYGLRAIFEISAIVYLKEHNLAAYSLKPSDKDPDKMVKNEYSLGKKLKVVHDHIIESKDDEAVKKELRSSLTELSGNGPLSVTSLNQLMHHQIWTTDLPNICKYFSHVFPLLRYMHQ